MIHQTAIIDRRAVLDSSVNVGPGVVIRGTVEIADGVEIGPNAVFIPRSPDEEDVATLVGRGVTIGANATVLAGVSIGRGAIVGAGAVVTRDVPPNARVVGNPARIIGYSTSPRFRASRVVRASTSDPSDLPLRIGRAQLNLAPRVDDLRGALTFGEVGVHLPFTPLRYFIVSEVPNQEIRGEHAHLECHQLLICVSGEVMVAIDDGSARGEVLLDRSDVALHLPPRVWASQYKYSADATLLVLASHTYDESDYIRDYDRFRALQDG